MRRLPTLALIFATSLASAPAQPGNPVVQAPTLISIDLRDRVVETPGPVAYRAVDGDELKVDGDLVPVWTESGIGREAKSRTLVRNGREVGKVFYSRTEKKPMLWRETTAGEPLDLEPWLKPESYRISKAAGDGSPLTPVAVHRKSRPANDNLTTSDKALDHRLYLVLPQPLEPGSEYRLTTPEGEKVFRYSPDSNEIEAIHVNQIGYRPDDPFKRAFLSLWTGTGGGWKFEAGEFEIIDDKSGEVVYRGRIKEGFPAEQVEGFRDRRNYVGADVSYLDFPDFRKSGTFRLRVPGLGVSRTFAIGEETWLAAFRQSMHGLLSHRSGIALGTPFTKYERPRPMHPEDGVVVFRIPYTMLEGEADVVKIAIEDMLDSGKPVSEWPVHERAWGGYMDAGDWDRRSQHLSVSRHLVELYKTNPKFFDQTALGLPPEETQDHIPDVLNEALWNIAFFRRLQEPDGGVGGGVESTEHPRPGERSWEESLVLGAFAPDPLSSFSYASAAALAASALVPHDPKLAAEYAESAERAWRWAEQNTGPVLTGAEARSREAGGTRFKREEAEKEIELMRLIAATDLFLLTGNQTYGGVVREKLPSAGAGAEELGAAFRLAMWPPPGADPALIEAARGKVLSNAGKSLKFGQYNAFGIHTQVEQLPMMGYTGFYSVPETITGPLLPRAYLLTGDKRFLAGALHAAHYSAGANPLNQTFTTGVGHDFPRHPLHIDSRMSGKEPPDGITVYGPSDPAANYGFNEWVHRWHLGGMVPPSRTWPAAESCVDIFLWPAQSEYTVHQTFRPTAYAWGFLASRKELDRE